MLQARGSLEEGKPAFAIMLEALWNLLRGISETPLFGQESYLGRYSAIIKDLPYQLCGNPWGGGFRAPVIFVAEGNSITA